MRSDEHNGLLLFWLSDDTDELYCTRIAPDGQVLWGDDDSYLLIAQTGDWEHLDLSVSADGEGGALVTYTQETVPNFDDIFAQHILADGTLAWGVDEVVVAEGDGREKDQEIFKADDQTWYMLYHSGPEGSKNPLFMQRMRLVNDDLVLDWNGTAGLQIEDDDCIRFSTGSVLPLVDGGAVVLWTRPEYAGGNRIVNQTQLLRLADDGATVWTVDDVIDDLYTYPGRYMLQDDDVLRAAYMVQAPGIEGLYTNSFSLTTGQMVDTQQTVVEGFAGNTREPQIISSGNSAYTLWNDRRHLDRGDRPYMQRIDLISGETMWTDHGIHIAPGLENAQYDSISVDCFTLDIQPDGTGGAFASWYERYTTGWEGGQRSRVQRVDAAGNLLWGEEGLTVYDADHNIFGHGLPMVLLPDGQGGLSVFFDLDDMDDINGVWFNHYDGNGQSTLADPQGVQLAETEYYSNIDGAVRMDDGTKMVFYHCGTDASRPLYAVAVNEAGETLWPEPVVLADLYACEDLDTFETIIQGDTVLTIICSNDSNRNAVYYLQGIDANGDLLYPDAPLDLEPITVRPGIAPRDANTFWCARQNGSYGEVVQVMDIQTGQVVGDPIELNSNTDYHWYNLLCPDGEGGVYATWMCVDGYTWDDMEMRYVHLKHDGSFASPDYNTEGLIFSDAPYEREDLVIAPDGFGGMLAVWNDYRGRLGYAPGDDVYAMRIHDMTTGMGEPSSAKVPLAWSLQPAYPNPFNPSTVVPFMLPHRAQVKIAVFDVLGREVATLLNEPVNGGAHQVVWNGDKTASGVYFVRMQADDFTATRRVVLMK